MEIIIENARHLDKILAICTKEFSGVIDPGNFIFLPLTTLLHRSPAWGFWVG
jgi:hypothetical protein